MKSKIFFVMVGLMMVFSLSVGQAFAQQSPMGGSSDPAKVEPREGAAAQDPMKAEPKAGAGVGKELTGSHRGSEFMNKTVKNDMGENLGKIKDFIFDREGELSYIVVSEAAAEDKLIPIPFTSGMVKFEEDSVVLSNVDKSKLDNAPTFGSAEWNKLDDPTFESTVHGYYSEGGAAGQIRGGAADPMKKTPEKKY
jgi:sporulation protein YlmC with PRC-barrel domain